MALAGSLLFHYCYCCFWCCGWCCGWWGHPQRCTGGSWLQVGWRTGSSLPFCSDSWSSCCWSVWQNLENSGWTSFVGERLQLLWSGEHKGLTMMVQHTTLESFGAQDVIRSHTAVPLTFQWVLDLGPLKPQVHYVPCHLVVHVITGRLTVSLALSSSSWPSFSHGSQNVFRGGQDIGSWEMRYQKAAVAESMTVGDH